MLSTSDDVDACQAVEGAHQLSVNLFTLHSTFLLQGLEQLLHRHGAVLGALGQKDPLVTNVIAIYTKPNRSTRD